MKKIYQMPLTAWTEVKLGSIIAESLEFSDDDATGETIVDGKERYNDEEFWGVIYSQEINNKPLW